MSGFKHGVEVLTVLQGARPIKTSATSVVGIIGTAPDADADKFPLNTPVAVFTAAANDALGASGTLPWSMQGFYDNGGGLAVIVRVEEGADEAATLANIVGVSADLTGVHAFKAADSLIKIPPRVLVATGWTHQRPGGNANPVAAALAGVAAALEAVYYVDAPNTTDAEAKTVADEVGDPRGRVAYPWALVFDTATSETVAQPISARMAGRRAQVDRDYGFWYSISNQPLAGITGVSLPIQHQPDNEGGQSNLLNAANVTTIIQNNGYKIWGNTGTGNEPLTAFQCVLRVQDVVTRATRDGYDWAVDKPQSAQLYLDVVDSQNAYLRSLTARGAILGGRAWFDEELNTKESLTAGRGYINFDLEPAAPMERLTFTAYRNPGYYQELIDEVTSATSAA